jgi:hypothetical protein
MSIRRETHTETTMLLTACDPAARLVLANPRIDGALDALGAAIVAAPTPPRRSRVSRPVLALAFAVAAVAIGGGVAAGAVLSAHTGATVPPADVPMGGPGEELNTAAPDFRSVALQIASDIPYPRGDGSWRDRVVSLSAGDGQTSSGALHGWFAMSAYCAWVRHWDQATASGDSAAAASAAQVIAQAPNWKAVTDEDPNPDPSAANDPGAETGTLFGWFLPYRNAVLADDRTRVEHLLSSGYGNGRCSLYDPVQARR